MAAMATVWRQPAPLPLVPNTWLPAGPCTPLDLRTRSVAAAAVPTDTLLPLPVAVAVAGCLPLQTYNPGYQQQQDFKRTRF